MIQNGRVIVDGGPLGGQAIPLDDIFFPYDEDPEHWFGYTLTSFEGVVEAFEYNEDIHRLQKG